jgi:hypothetical protein
MRKFLGLAALGLIAAGVTLAAPATSDAQVVVRQTPVVTTAPVVTYRAHRPGYHSYRGRVVRHRARAWGRPHYHYRHHHARHWRR